MECAYNNLPYKNCSAVKKGIHCWDRFENGICDEACNNAECLYDGFDCLGQMKECNPIYESYCLNHYANGHCDKGCDNMECEWDGLDCVNGDRETAEGVLILILLIKPDDFRLNATVFVRRLGHMLRTVVWVKKDSEGQDMIYPWPRDSVQERVKRWVRSRVTRASARSLSLLLL